MLREGRSCVLAAAWGPEMGSSSSAYGYVHQQRRAELLPDAYGTPCPRCGELMLRGQALDLGHSTDLVVDSQAVGDRIEHADYRDCPVGGNRAAGGKLGKRRQRFRPSRTW